MKLKPSTYKPKVVMNNFVLQNLLKLTMASRSRFLLFWSCNVKKTLNTKVTTHRFLIMKVAVFVIPKFGVFEYNKICND